MHVTTLPKDLPIGNAAQLQLYDYRNFQDLLKTKIQLSKHTISFLRKGQKEVMGDDKTVQIDPQHFVIMKAGNCLMTETTSKEDHFYQSMLLFFPAEAVQAFVEKHQPTSHASAENRSFYILPYDRYIQQFVVSLDEVLKLPLPTQGFILANKFEEILLYLSHAHGAAFLHSLVQAGDHKRSRLTNIVENNKLNKLSLEELAFLASMSVSTFKRAFFQEYQQTPMKWFRPKGEDLVHSKKCVLWQENLISLLYQFAQQARECRTVEQFQTGNVVVT
ncbi:MAG: AraC family transcriptional regulator [Bacteroidota bacterium]